MFEVEHKETGERLKVFGMLDVPPDRNDHDGFTLFLVEKDGEMTTVISSKYKRVASE